MEELCKYLRSGDSITTGQLRIELQNLGNQFTKQSIADAYVVQEDSDNKFEHHVTLVLSAAVESFHRCLQGHFIGLAYKLLLALPVSQATCERSFSALKRIKNRLRSTTTQEHLEAFMLMSVEKGIQAKLDNKDIIDSIAASIDLRRHLLT